MFRKRLLELCDHFVAVPAKYTGGAIVQRWLELTRWQCAPRSLLRELPLALLLVAALFPGLPGVIDRWSAVFGFAAGRLFARAIHGRLAGLGCLRRDGGPRMAAGVGAHAQQIGQFGRAANIRILDLTRFPLLSTDIGKRED